MSQDFPCLHTNQQVVLLFKDSIARPPRLAGVAPNPILRPLRLAGLSRGLANR